MISKLASAARHERLAREAALSMEDRVRLALRLGERCLDIYAQLHPELSRTEARAALAAARQVGRRPSRVKTG